MWYLFWTFGIFQGSPPGRYQSFWFQWWAVCGRNISSSRFWTHILWLWYLHTFASIRLSTMLNKGRMEFHHCCNFFWYRHLKSQYFLNKNVNNSIVYCVLTLNRHNRTKVQILICTSVSYQTVITLYLIHIWRCRRRG